jgi:YVTN family beta-propeller protein
MTALLVWGCGAASQPSPTPSSPRSTEPTATAAPAAFASGAWEGDLVDANGGFPIRLALDGCATDGAVCGQLEYGDPGGADQVFCASELTRTGVDGDALALSEDVVYRPWMCFPGGFKATPAADGGIEIEQLLADGEVFARGSLARIGDALPAAEVPDAKAIEGLGQITAGTALGGATTQYAAAADGSLWFPLEDRGQVARVDAATGEILALIEVGDPGAIQDMPSDPHGVAAGEAGIWVGNAAERSVALIDPTTNAVADTIPVSIAPYALALDGSDLWVTSFLDDRVVRVDVGSGKVVREIEVPKPSGIAIGLDGVWVVNHRDDKLARIDPKTNEIVAEIELGERGPNDLCGMCVENVVVADDAVWTANNEGRSITRIDPASNKVTATIELPMRPWQVTAGGGSIWASQFDGDGNGGFLNPITWKVARIDPATNEATTYSVPGAMGVTWGLDALWVASPGRRGDALARVEVAQ